MMHDHDILFESNSNSIKITVITSQGVASVVFRPISGVPPSRYLSEDYKLSSHPAKGFLVTSNWTMLRGLYRLIFSAPARKYCRMFFSDGEGTVSDRTFLSTSACHQTETLTKVSLKGEHIFSPEISPSHKLRVTHILLLFLLR